MILTVKWLCLDFAPFGSRVMTRKSGLPDFRQHPSFWKYSWRRWLAGASPGN